MKRAKSARRVVPLMCREQFPADPALCCELRRGHKLPHRVSVPMGEIAGDVYGVEMEWPPPASSPFAQQAKAAPNGDAQRDGAAPRTGRCAKSAAAVDAVEPTPEEVAAGIALAIDAEPAKEGSDHG